MVYPELEPLAGTNLMVGHLVSFLGAAERYLGMLAATVGERELAERHFDEALRRNSEMGATTWAAHTAYEYARFLLGCGEQERAGQLLERAGAMARGADLAALAGRIDSLAEADRVGALPDDISPREAQILRLVARGLSNRELGEELSISEHTAANHVRSILRKTGCANRTEAASDAHRHGLAST
jgi:DNA-binding CsgD family transcriptional regulator